MAKQLSTRPSAVISTNIVRRNLLPHSLRFLGVPSLQFGTSLEMTRVGAGFEMAKQLSFRMNVLIIISTMQYEESTSRPRTYPCHFELAPTLVISNPVRVRNPGTLVLFKDKIPHIHCRNNNKNIHSAMQYEESTSRP